MNPYQEARLENPDVFNFIDDLFPTYGIDPSMWEFSECQAMAGEDDGEDVQYYGIYYSNINDENVTFMIELSERPSLHENTTTLKIETLEMSMD